MTQFGVGQVVIFTSEKHRRKESECVIIKLCSDQYHYVYFPRWERKFTVKVKNLRPLDGEDSHAFDLAAKTSLERTDPRGVVVGSGRRFRRSLGSEVNGELDEPAPLNSKNPHPADGPPEQL